jgi:hypothetical protein
MILDALLARDDAGPDQAFLAFVAALREMNVTPHVAQSKTNRRFIIDGRMARHLG